MKRHEFLISAEQPQLLHRPYPRDHPSPVRHVSGHGIYPQALRTFLVGRHLCLELPRSEGLPERRSVQPDTLSERDEHVDPAGVLPPLEEGMEDLQLSLPNKNRNTHSGLPAAKRGR